jgi:hypothetical protein
VRVIVVGVFKSCLVCRCYWSFVVGASASLPHFDEQSARIVTTIKFSPRLRDCESEKKDKDVLMTLVLPNLRGQKV